MTSASPLCLSLPLERQHLVAFTERHYVHAAAQVLVRLARLHQWPWEPGAQEVRPWVYDHELHQSGQATLETLQRVIREQGVTQCCGRT
jgi:hypothetical protein